MILKDEIHIRLMTNNDFDLMVKWLNDPRVLEFYEEPPTNLERVINKFGPRISECGGLFKLSKKIINVL